MKSYSVVFFFLFITLSSFAQNQDNSDTDRKTSYITANPFPIADPYAPRIRFGYTQHLAPHWKAGLDIGLGVKEIALTASQSVGVDYFLWEIRPEVHYILNPEARTLKYLSVEFFYIDQDHIFENGDYIAENSGDIRFDSADFTRQKYGMHFKFGLFLDIGKHVGFNFFGGVGFRIANKQYSNVVNPTEDDIFREWFADPYEIEGKNIRFNPSLGIRFYYKL